MGSASFEAEEDVRPFHHPGGRFKDRPFFTSRQIESICEEALRSVDLLPTIPSPVRIERFVEKRFNLCPDYAELPENVLGYTALGPDGPSRMVIARLLADAGSKSSERRINTTLAHESGHCLLHAHLFRRAEMSGALFQEDIIEPNTPKILCRDEASGNYDGKWWEFQANAAIGPLLLPRHLLAETMVPFLEVRGLLGIEVLPDGKRRTAELAVSQIFDVNPVAARIRLQQLYANPNQEIL